MPSVKDSVLGLLGLATTNLAHVLPTVRQPPQLASRNIDDFQFPSGAGACSESQMDAINEWIDDVTDILIPAALDALDAYTPNTAQTLMALLGVEYDVILNEPKDKDELATIKRWFDEAHSFLDGKLVGTDYDHDKAWIFCGDNYQEHKSVNDVAYNTEGEALKDDDGEDVRIWQVPEYAAKLSQGRVPVWIPDVNAYRFARSGDFLPGTPGTECTAARAFVYTVSRNLIIDVCTSGKEGGLFEFGSSDVIDGVEVTEHQLIDRLRSQSIILLHETFHAIRPWDNDHAKNSHQCYSLAISDRSKAQASPECLALFAAAMYFQTNSQNDEKWVFWRLYAEHQDDAWGDLAKSPAA